MQVMGVINVTPDSFVAEVRTPDPDAAVARCRRLVAEGATILDIGGESTRPGASSVPIDEELVRVVPVIERFNAEAPAGVSLSVDTRHEAVARAAVAAGARIINDMGASLGAIAGELQVGYVAAHMQGEPTTMQDDPRYGDVVEEVFEAVVAEADRAAAAGAGPIWIDPGIGFGKRDRHNLALLSHIDRFVDNPYPVLIGVSRKGMMGRLHAASDSGRSLDEVSPSPTDDRLESSLAIASWCAALGVDVIRVHDVAETVQALAVVAAGSVGTE